MHATSLVRDFPDDSQPTSAVGLSDDSITDREISKHSLCSMGGISGRFRAMMLPEAAP